MGAMDTCCMYFCTGLSFFGVIALVVMAIILSSGGQWYLGVSDEGAAAAATSCWIAAGIYGGYLTLCGWRVCNASKKARTQLPDEPDA